jgi:hypothetical protein
MSQPAPFKLPQVSWSKHGIKLLSFRQDALEILGSYLPGEGAVVVDPFWTGAKSPAAIAEHEMQHQLLTINTTFGIYTQILFFLAQDNFALEALRMCLEKQWCVQELAATYAEMSLICEERPELLQEEVRKLPSAMLDQPPYREVFDSMNRLLPVDPLKPANILSAQQFLVTAIAVAAMQSDCLLRMAAAPHLEGALLACMDDPPCSRLERIAHRLENLLPALISETVEQLARPEDSYTYKNSPILFVIERIASLVPEVSIQPEAACRSQSAKALAAWRSDIEQITGKRVNTKQKRRAKADPLPIIMESRERERRAMAAHPPQDLVATILHDRLALTVRQSLGITLELAVPPDIKTHVIASSYFTKSGAVLQPASAEELPGEPLPQNISGLMSPPEILRALEAFPALPHVVTFIDDGWRHWYQTPGARARFKSCVQICRQTHLSRNDVLYSILAFEDLGEGSEFFVTRFHQGKYVGCIFNRARPLVYGLQKIPTELGLGLFAKICGEFRLVPCKDPASVIEYKDLLDMVSRDYFFG